MVVINRQPILVSEESSKRKPHKNDEKKRKMNRRHSSRSSCLVMLSQTQSFLTCGQQCQCCCILLHLMVIMAFLSVTPSHWVRQRLNLLLGRKRPGQGLEVRAVIPLNIHPPSIETNSFTGRRCHDYRGSIVCEECLKPNQCTVLHPHDRKCRQPPMKSSSCSVTSQYNRHSSEPIAFVKVMAANHVEYNFHPICSMEACWNLTRCAAPANERRMVLTVNLKGHTSTNVGSTDTYFRLTDAMHGLDSIELVDEADDACLVVFLLNDGDKLSTEDFPENGQNVLVWDLSDLAATQNHYGKATIASRSGFQPWLRLEYDIILPQRQIHPPVVRTDQRQLLSIAYSNSDLIPQWIAYQFWQNSDQPNASVARPSCPSGKQPQHTVVEILNTTFTFLPNGSNSLLQILSIGSIPVVEDWKTLPFWPEVAWEQCAVQIETTLIVDLPNLLTIVQPSELTTRRERCTNIHRRVFGNGDIKASTQDDDVQSFTVALSILHGRIRRARQLKESLMTSMSNLKSHSR